ncbi:MAG: PspC domain-containing protein [Armatimonadota bacterium]|nr:PspC domain-containing protein [Armatimonadota bacterium]MDR5697154.1 PspC domain-containing protein [Armatimonadota bacterium]
MARRLRKSGTNRLLLGVAGGLGEYFNVDPLVFRVVFILLAFGSGAGILLYLLLAALMPRAESVASASLEALKDNIATAPRELTDAGRRVIRLLRGIQTSSDRDGSASEHERARDDESTPTGGGT